MDKFLLGEILFINISMFFLNGLIAKFHKFKNGEDKMINLLEKLIPRAFGIISPKIIMNTSVIIPIKLLIFSLNS